MPFVKLTPDQQQAFASAVQKAQSDDQVHRAVQNVYVALQDAIDLRKPLCVQSGRCCHFDDFGHRLFVTTMEMGTFLSDLKRHGYLKDHDPGGCPFQSDKLCQVHTIRPFGCRIFFCDSTATTWQQEQYARFHAELKRLHEGLKIDYFYVEWREALLAVGLLPPIAA